MIVFLKTFKFYLKYYITNHIIPHIPFHIIRLAWYRNIVGMKIGENSFILLGCQFIGVTDRIDATPGLEAEQIGRERNGNGDGFEMAWRHVDDQPPDLAAPDLIQHMRDGLDVPIR